MFPTRSRSAEPGGTARTPLILFPVDYQSLLDGAMTAAAATAGHGRVADYIPALASVDPDVFGIAMATFDGAIYAVGEAERPFSIQSVSKLFALALLMAEIGERRKVVRIVVHIVSIGHLRGASMPTPIMRNHTIPFV